MNCPLVVEKIEKKRFSCYFELHQLVGQLERKENLNKNCFYSILRIKYLNVDYVTKQEKEKEE